MRVKLICDVWSPEGTLQQSPGWKSTRQRALEPWVSGEMLKALQGRRRLSASPLQGLYHFSSYPGFRPLRVLHPGLCCIVAFGAAVGDFGHYQ